MAMALKALSYVINYLSNSKAPASMTEKSLEAATKAKEKLEAQRKEISRGFQVMGDRHRMQ